MCGCYFRTVRSAWYWYLTSMTNCDSVDILWCFFPNWPGAKKVTSRVIALQDNTSQSGFSTDSVLAAIRRANLAWHDTYDTNLPCFSHLWHFCRSRSRRSCHLLNSAMYTTSSDARSPGWLQNWLPQVVQICKNIGNTWGYIDNSSWLVVQ